MKIAAAAAAARQRGAHDAGLACPPRHQPRQPVGNPFVENASKGLPQPSGIVGKARILRLHFGIGLQPRLEIGALVRRQFPVKRHLDIAVSERTAGHFSIILIVRRQAPRRPAVCATPPAPRDPQHQRSSWNAEDDGCVGKPFYRDHTIAVRRSGLIASSASRRLRTV